mmetsp:Transcript_23369/g.29466  ORF Transcript_23369/g.29466 Transcript_23369/m.29466 type:complete len:429 (+) Transcript_23369:3-1289(+)
MVEGPGATRNGRKVEQRVLERRIQSIQCISNPKVASVNDQGAWWTGRSLSQVISIGKELFLVFAREGEMQKDEDVAIRLHFGMNGSLEISSSATANKNSDRRNSHKGIPSIMISFTESISSSGNANFNKKTETIIVKAYQTTISGPMNAKIPRTKFTNLSTCDVCNVQFNHHHVLRKIRNSMVGDRIISDALLDQNVLPGSGNIIKIEGLHNARVHPKQMVSSLSDDQLRLAILSCRSYAMKWFKNGSAPQKSVYNQMVCGTCKEAKICMQRVGYSSRTTFWCSICQPFQRNVEINEGQSESPSQVNHNTNNNNQQPIMPNIKALRKVCPCHGPDTLVLRRARNGANASRIFYSCRVKNCTFFAWADRFFPLCNCRERSVLLVSKTERTGGRFFFSCRNEKRGEKCGYFAWAQQKDLERLGDRLTPLL